MKVFKVNDKIQTHLNIVDEPYRHIGIGEEGRGRRYTRVGVGKNVEGSRITEASVMRTKKGSLLIVEEREKNDNRALVHLAIAAGYRGGLEYTSTEPVTGVCTHDCTGHTWYTCPVCRSPLDAEDRHMEERVITRYLPLEEVEGVKILARGYCAQGAAGYMGGHPEYLVIMDAGTTIRVKRGGRLYGRPDELFVHWDGENLKLGTRDEVFPTNEEE